MGIYAKEIELKAIKKYAGVRWPVFAYLIEISGTDPNIVAEDGVTAEGYRRFLHHVDGSRVLDDKGFSIKVWTEWTTEQLGLFSQFPEYLPFQINE